jgi:hypothetical protein
MTQAISIIRDALEQIRVADANAVLDENDTATALRTMNAMMRAWETDGLSVGWSDIQAATDDMPTAPEFDEAIAANLGVRLASRYGAEPSPALVALASGGVSLIRASVANADYARIHYDDLPVGVDSRGGSPRAFFYR